MKKTINQMDILLEHHQISLPEGARKTDPEINTNDHEIFYALKDGFSKSQAFLIDFGASNHMVSSKESFSSLNLIDGLSIHMGDDTQIQAVGKHTIQLKHGVFKNVLYVPSLEKKLLSV